MNYKKQLFATSLALCLLAFVYLYLHGISSAAGPTTQYSFSPSKEQVYEVQWQAVSSSLPGIEGKRNTRFISIASTVRLTPRASVKADEGVTTVEFLTASATAAVDGMPIPASELDKDLTSLKAAKLSIIRHKDASISFQGERGLGFMGAPILAALSFGKPSEENSARTDVAKKVLMLNCENDKKDLKTAKFDLAYTSNDVWWNQRSTIDIDSTSVLASEVRVTVNVEGDDLKSIAFVRCTARKLEQGPEGSTTRNK